MSGAQWRRYTGWLVLLALVAAGLVYAFLPQPILVDLATVERGPLLVTIDDEGETRVRDVYTVSAPVAGRMLRIDSKVGDLVQANDTVLAVLEPSDPAFLDARRLSQAEAEVNAAAAALAQAEAERERAQAELDYAEAELRRMRVLAERGNVSQSALDRAQMALRTNEAALNTARAALQVRRSQLETARAALIGPTERLRGGEDCCINLTAPVTGRVLRLVQKSEQVVAAGTSLIEIGNPAELEVVVDLLSAEAVRVVEGAEVLLTDWGGGTVLPGRVRTVEPYGFTKVSALGIEEQRVNVVIDFTGDAAARARLGHGYRVQARIVVWRGADVVKVPIGALFRSGNAWAAFVVEAGRARLRRLEIGRSNGEEAEVLAGLAPGAQVVLHPSDRVVDGSRLQDRGAT